MPTERSTPPALPKALTGITGLDEITFGGLPRGRPTLIVGGAGSGKTMLAMEFLVRGATEFDEPGVYVAFEETAADLAVNFSSRGFDLDKLQREKKIFIDHVHIERSEIEETGEYDLEGLFIRLAHAVNTVGAKRVVLDTVEALFAGLSNTAILRAELRRLFTWLKTRGLTAIITGERGDETTLTRYGLEEYVADCVMVLDHRVTEQITTRRLRVMKYRGSQHGTNEYPFLIENTGISVLPITSTGLTHTAPNDRVSTGVDKLDAMIGGTGYFRGSSILVSGTAGTGKSSLAASFAQAACRRGEKCIYFAFEESPQQIIRNMRSIGIDLEPYTKKGLLMFHAARPTAIGMETHLAETVRMVKDIKPTVMVLDPISNLISVGSVGEVKSMLTRLIDFLKMNHITALFTNLSTGIVEMTQAGISSLMDTWIMLRDVEINGERNRELHVLKSRGMAHSNQLREFVLTSHGIELIEPYVGPAGVLTGTARVAQEAKERAEALLREQGTNLKQRELERKRADVEIQVRSLRAGFEAAESELEMAIKKDEVVQRVLAEGSEEMAKLRGAQTGSMLEKSKRKGSQGGKK